MTHISRPFQIALVAMALFAAVWFVALRGHSTSSEGSGSSAPSSPGQAAAPAKASSSGGAGSSPGSVYHGPAPGVAGLTRAITKAQGAVAQSQQNAKQLQEKSAQASSSTQTQSSQTKSSQAQSPTQANSSSGLQARSTSASSGQSPSATPPGSSTPAKQLVVERELKAGQTVILLFWNPTGSDDVAVHGQLQRLQAFHKAFGSKQNKRIAVHEARAKDVALFGAITRSLQINQTPTMLIISPGGNTKTLTGLADAYTIQQAISEARHS